MKKMSGSFIMGTVMLLAALQYYLKKHDCV